MALTPEQETTLQFVTDQLTFRRIEVTQENIFAFILDNLALLQDPAQIAAAVQAKKDQDKQQEILALTARLEALSGGIVIIGPPKP